MSAVVWIGLGVLGGVGAILRFLLDGAIGARVRTGFPLGTLIVNLSGAFVLGVLTEALADGDALRIAATGLIGSYTTFSTWMLETERLAEDGRGRAATANVLVSLIAGVVAAWLGLRVGGIL